MNGVDLSEQYFISAFAILFGSWGLFAPYEWNIMSSSAPGESTSPRARIA